MLVTGPQSSGTRLLCDVLVVGGLDVWHDKSHGTEPLEAERVVVIVRDARATEASRDAAFAPADRIDRASSLAGAARYSGALWVTYEQLCDAPQATVGHLAAHLGREPWDIGELSFVNQNAKHASGGGPQLEHLRVW